MRWILCGKNDAACQALEYACERGDDLLVVGGAGDDGRDGWQRSLRGAAEEQGVPFLQPKRVNEPRVIEQLAAFRADALISIQYEQILRRPFFEGVGCACLNLHFALLPRHRGVAPIAWAVLEGDHEAGVTLHHMVPEIDAGDVIARRAVPIGAADSAREVYERVSLAAVALFRESHPFPASLLARRLVQSEADACYHRAGDFDFSRRAVDWSQPAAKLQRWLRALIFPPLQLPETRRDGGRLRIERVSGEVGAAAGAPPGRVLEVDEAGARVAAGDGSVCLARVVDERGAPVRLRVGERLGGVGGDA